MKDVRPTSMLDILEFLSNMLKAQRNKHLRTRRNR